MSEPIKLVERQKPTPNEAVVGRLEHLLEEAKKGEISGLAYCYTTETGIYPDWTGAFESVSHLIGVIERMKFDILVEHDKMRD